ncbi:unnamed protein product [Taenia asiatica]|uniref:Protein tweety homolog n=1 Tax=Taenia asiatica TaxID=60517 RepID=A0A0R3WFY1_TAEAS|nr:unnamed protein product [Taenia asiatica]
MRVLNNTITQLHTPLNQVNSIIDAIHSSKSDILLPLEKEINFDQVFVSLDTFWKNVGGQADDIVHRLQQAANSLKKQLEDASGPIKITLYCVGGCLTFIILTAAIVNICMIYHVTRNRFSADPGNSSKGEGCMYLIRETATNKTDFVLNGYVAHHWDSLIRGASSDAAEFVITTPPKNPLFALTKTCNTKTSHRGVGLLSALGYSNMVNTSRILFLDLLDPASINTTEVIHLMDMLKVLVESSQTSKKDDIQVAIGSLGEVVKRMDEFKILATETRESILSIDKEKDGLIASFDAATTALLDSIEFGRNESALMAEVEKQYDALAVGLTEFIEADGDGLFAQLTQDLLPCDKAHAAYTVAMEVTCGESGGVTRLLGFVCVLAFNIVFLVLLHFGIFSLAYLQTLQARLLAGEAASRVGWVDEETSATTTTTRRTLPVMGLHFSLLATVAAIMVWVIQTETGGFLNAIFLIVWPSKGHELEFELSTNVAESISNFLKTMLLLQPLPLPILQVIPESLGGGQTGVDNAHANPNRGPDIFWITILTFLFSVVLIVLIQVINCCCCCDKEKDLHGSMNALQMALLRSKFTNKQFILRIVYIVALVLALVFLAASIILLIVYFSSTGLVVAYLETNPQPSVGNRTPVSLPDGLHATVLHASSFVGKGITEGRVLTNTTLHGFVDRVYEKLREEVLTAINQLLAYLGVQNALEKGENAVQAVQTLLNLLSETYGNVTLLYNETILLGNKLDSARKAYFEVLKNVHNCSSLDLCKTLNETIANITSPISSTKLNATLLKPYIEGLNETVTDLSSPLAEVRESINSLHNSTNDILNSLKSQLNLTHILDQIETFWNGVQSRADELQNQLNDTVNSVETQLQKYVYSIRVGFFIVGGVLMIILIIATLIAMYLVYRAIHDRLFTHHKKAFIGSRTSKWDDVVCGRNSVCCCSALFIPFLLIFAVIIAVLLFVLTTISSEGCIYLERESAVKMSDFVVNGYMARQWKTLIGDAVGGSADFLNTPPPKNILLALTQTCNGGTSQHPVGLLSALGYRNLVNVSKLVNSPDLTQAIERGRQYAFAFPNRCQRLCTSVSR